MIPAPTGRNVIAQQRPGLRCQITSCPEGAGRNTGGMSVHTINALCRPYRADDELGQGTQGDAALCPGLSHCAPMGLRRCRTRMSSQLQAHHARHRRGEGPEVAAEEARCHPGRLRRRNRPHRSADLGGSAGVVWVMNPNGIPATSPRLALSRLPWYPAQHPRNRNAVVVPVSRSPVGAGSINSQPPKVARADAGNLGLEDAASFGADGGPAIAPTQCGSATASFAVGCGSQTRAPERASVRRSRPAEQLPSSSGSSNVFRVRGRALWPIARAAGRLRHARAPHSKRGLLRTGVAQHSPTADPARSPFPISKS